MEGESRRRFLEDSLTPYTSFSTKHALQLIQQWLHEQDYHQALAALERERHKPPCSTTQHIPASSLLRTRFGARV